VVNRLDLYTLSVTVLWMLKNHMIVDNLIFVVRNYNDDPTGVLEYRFNNIMRNYSILLQILYF